MVKLARISYEGGSISYFYVNSLSLNKNQFVIVNSDRGLQVGQVISEVREYDDKDVANSYYDVIRVMTKNDFNQENKNKKEALKAVIKARELANKLNLDMGFIDAFFTFDRNQLVFNFMADKRVDFRELVKGLAQIYHTRIELRQVGVRDKAKQIGGIGPCGRFLCCSTFLNDFASVSINMAKNQYIALNPTKINGVCGRLLCCLKYENDQYKEMRKGVPKIGQIIEYSGIKGKVSSINLLTGKMIIEQGNKNYVEVKLEENNGST